MLTRNFLLPFVLIHAISLALVPYAQASANSHYYEGRFFGLLYYAIAFLVAMGVAIKSKGFQWDRTTLLRWGLIVVSLIGWGYYLRMIVCLRCLNAG